MRIFKDITLPRSKDLNMSSLNKKNQFHYSNTKCVFTWKWKLFLYRNPMSCSKGIFLWSQKFTFKSRMGIKKKEQGGCQVTNLNRWEINATVFNILFGKTFFSQPHPVLSQLCNLKSNDINQFQKQIMFSLKFLKYYEALQSFKPAWDNNK